MTLVSFLHFTARVLLLSRESLRHLRIRGTHEIRAALETIVPGSEGLFRVGREVTVKSLDSQKFIHTSSGQRRCKVAVGKI